MSNKISLIIISLNEIDGLKVIGDRVNNQKKFLKEIILVDGGSTDGTIEYAKSLGWRVIIQNEEELGIINGLKIGVDASIGEYVLFFTPDNNCIPEKISEVYNLIKQNYDMITVSRYFKNAKSHDDTFLTGFGNWMFTFIVNFLFRSNYTDVLGIYRCVKKSLLHEMHIKFDLLSISTLICIRCKKFNKKTIDIAGDEPPRIGGKSYMRPLKNGSQELYTIIKEFIIR